MSKKKDDIKKIWRECFNDSAEYVDMYFDRVYTDSQGIILEKNDKPVSSLLLQPYEMKFHGATPLIGYIAGAATRKGSRGQGYMSELMRTALYEASARDMMAVALIPATPALYDFYARMDFAPVVMADAQRFTSLHAFSCAGEYERVENPADTAVYDAFSAMERERGCTVLHSQQDFLNTIADINICRGSFVCLRRKGEEEPVAMAWATEGDDDRIVIKELLGKDDDSREAAMQAVRDAWPDRPLTLLAPPPEGRVKRRLMPRGMIRIVNALKTLEIIARANPKLTLTLKLTDRLMPENSHLYRINKGLCDIIADDGGPYDFNVDAQIFSRIVFNSSRMADVLEFPSVRPWMSLMLD